MKKNICIDCKKEEAEFVCKDCGALYCRSCEGYCDDGICLNCFEDPQPNIVPIEKEKKGKSK